MKRNIDKMIEDGKKAMKVNKGYALLVGEMDEIVKGSNGDWFRVSFYSFLVGVTQGIKIAKKGANK